jgi:hypothetical protein
MVVSGIRPSFPGLSQSQGQVTHVLLTRSPLIPQQAGIIVRLACVKHAASVHPEPGSNSPLKTKKIKQTQPHPPEITVDTAAQNSKPAENQTTTHGGARQYWP